MRVIRERVTLVLAVLPFERALYRQAKVPVEFVGHPIADALVGAPSRADARRRLGLGDGDLVIGLLPGSRPQEIARLTPIIRDAAATLASRHPNARFVLALAPTVSAADVTAHLGAGPRIDLVSDAHADRKSTRLNSSHSPISYAVFCLTKEKKTQSAMGASKTLNDCLLPVTLDVCLTSTSRSSLLSISSRVSAFTLAEHHHNTS